MLTRAKDIMTTNLILGYPEMTLEEAIKTLVNNRITGMPIVDDKKRMIGVCSELDIIKSVEQTEKGKPLDLHRTIHFTHKVVTIDEETQLTDILKMFVELKVRRLPVVNNKEELVGIISRRDIMRVLFYRSKTI